MIQKSNNGWAFCGSVLIYKATGAIFSNDELGEKHERTVLKTNPVCEAEAIQRDLSISLLWIRMDRDPTLTHWKGNTKVSFSNGSLSAGPDDLIALLQFCKRNGIRVCLIDRYIGVLGVLAIQSGPMVSISLDACIIQE